MAFAVLVSVARHLVLLWSVEGVTGCRAAVQISLGANLDRRAGGLHRLRRCGEDRLRPPAEQHQRGRLVLGDECRNRMVRLVAGTIESRDEACKEVEREYDAMVARIAAAKAKGWKPGKIVKGRDAADPNSVWRMAGQGTDRGPAIPRTSGPRHPGEPPAPGVAGRPYGSSSSSLFVGSAT